jgi:hypothetical protein
MGTQVDAHERRHKQMGTQELGTRMRNKNKQWKKGHTSEGRCWMEMENTYVGTGMQQEHNKRNQIVAKQENKNTSECTQIKHHSGTHERYARNRNIM